jgi:hypothetical protein
MSRKLIRVRAQGGVHRTPGMGWPGSAAEKSERGARKPALTRTPARWAAQGLSRGAHPVGNLRYEVATQNSDRAKARPHDRGVGSRVVGVPAVACVYVRQTQLLGSVAEARVHYREHLVPALTNEIAGDRQKRADVAPGSVADNQHAHGVITG